MDDEGRPEIAGQKAELEFPRRRQTARQNPDIADIIYLSFRRIRVDYQPEKSSLFNNGGFEYTYDMDRRTFNPIRHYFFVE
jgi:hypothetical protein